MFNNLRQELDQEAHASFLRVLPKLFLLPKILLKKLAEKLSLLPYPIDHLELVTTSKCSLRCAKCANLMQYDPCPEHFDINMLLQDLGCLFELNVKIKRFNVIGGEPFLYPHLVALLNFLVLQPKIGYIRLVTNGTIIPNKELLTVLSNPKIEVHISNYISLGIKTNEVLQFLIEHKVNAQVITFAWKDYHHNFDASPRSIKEMTQIYQNCGMNCHEIVNGEIHLCPTSAHGMRLGLIPRDEHFFVNIRHNHSSQQKKQTLSKIKKLFSLPYTIACRYCNGGNGKIIPVAEQLKQ